MDESGRSIQMSDSNIRSIVCHDMCVGYSPLPSVNPADKAVSKHISFEVHRGELMAIMGPSGSGKSTLLRGLLGQAPYVSGTILVNGHDCSRKGGLGVASHKVGVVPQADVLVDELSMMENIHYFHTIAVDSGLSPAAIDKKAAEELASLGLKEDTSKPRAQRLTQKRVGDGSGRKSNISGGQAKRANIAMELVNDPDVLIIDEPTSGLSSHDSLELLKKLREIADQGKIVLIIIHQPSSEIFKLFDRVLLLDGKGQCVCSGTRAEVERWATRQGQGSALHCSACKSWFPDKLLHIVESQNNGDWKRQSIAFTERFLQGQTVDTHPLPKKPLVRPFQAWFDLIALFKRNLLVKWRDRSSMLLSFVAPPLLGFLFASVFSAAPPGQDYSFAQNGLFPQLVFMLIICTMFLGMVSSGVEIIRDRPMLEREVTRGLKLWAYYGTKFAGVMVFGLVQSSLLAFSAAATSGAMHLWPTLTVILSLVMAMGVSLGLLVSVLSQTPTKAFYLVLVILLPQIVLGGALLPYRDMGKALYLGENKVAENRPLTAALMPSSWAHQFAMRLIYDQSQDTSASAMNLSVADMRHIPNGGFMSLKLTRQVKAEPLEMLDIPMPAVWKRWHKKNYTEDAAVLLGIALSALLLGWALVGKNYRLGSGARWQRRLTSAAALVLVPMSVAGLTTPVPKPGNAVKTMETGIDFVVGPAPMTLSAALQHCAALSSRLPQLPEFLDLYETKRKDLVTSTYWIANDTQAPNATAVLSLSTLGKLDEKQRSPAIVRATKGALIQKVNPTQKHRFLCVPLPKLPSDTARK